MSREISAERKTAHYVGMPMIVVGFMTFMSVFGTVASNFGDHTNVQSSGQSFVVRAIIGMGLVFAGGIVMNIGRRGLAGSGVVLDPEQAREELEPYSRMAGGMVKDALEEADLDLGSSKQQVVMIRCRACSKLNEEDSKFCQECGEAI